MSPRKYQQGTHLVLRKRGGSSIWYVYHEGRQTSLQTSDKAEAERRLVQFCAGGWGNRAGLGESAESTLLILAEAFLDAPHGYTRRTLASARNRLVSFGIWSATNGVQYPREVTAAKLDTWINARSSQASRRTINRDLRVIRVLFRWGFERGHCLENKAVIDRKDLREPKREKRHVVPDPGEMARILAALEEQHSGAWCAARVLYGSGVRIEELRRLTFVDIRKEGLHVTPEEGAMDEAEPGKGYEERVVPINDDTRLALRAFFQWRASPRTACAEGWLLRRIAKACRSAGVPECTVHDLRRAFVTECYRANIPLPLIQKWVGHKDVRTTESYIADYRSDEKIGVPTLKALRATDESWMKVGVVAGRIGSAFSENGRSDGGEND